MVYSAVKRIQCLGLAAAVASSMFVFPSVAFAAQTNTGWKNTGNAWYYLDSSGNVTTGWKAVNNAWYYMDTSGVMQTGWLHENNAWYYLNPSGAMVTGWKLIGDKWYYMDTSGAMQTGWLSNESAWYYLDTSGAMRTGWQKIDNVWYYMDSSGVMQTGWIKDKGKWYYLKASGAMATGWQKVGGTWYYFNKFGEGTEGAMRTGWVKVKDVWYYLDESGAMATEWRHVDGRWYLLGKDGAMKTGWQKNRELWYYLDSSGAMRTGWVNDKGSWYYLSDDGSMRAERTFDVVEKGGTYTVTEAKKAAALEAARIVIREWDLYAGAYRWQEAPPLDIEDYDSVAIGNPIPECTYLDGKIVFGHGDLYPVFCDQRLVTFILLGETDATDKAGAYVPPTQSIKDAGYGCGPYVELYTTSEACLRQLREGCALVSDGFAGAQFLVSKDSALLVSRADAQGSAKTLEAAMLAKMPHAALYSKPYSI